MTEFLSDQRKPVQNSPMGIFILFINQHKKEWSVG